MKRHHRPIVIPLAFGLIAIIVFFSLRFFVINIKLFEAAGTIAHKEHELMVIAVLLMLLVIIPVFGLIIGFAWWYRADNKKATYKPEWDHAKTDELIWWAIPFEIVLVLAALTWTSTHELDPYRPISSDVPPVTIEVIALDWKWLFIYPKEGIATVNQLTIPVNTPINFKLTADAPMNALWIPRLGGQIMAMSGMVTQLHLLATEEGTFQGRSANFSGDGFSGMQFDTKVVDNDAFKAWVSSVRNSGATLNRDVYNVLAKPTINQEPEGYKLESLQLFDSVVAKFMSGMDMVQASSAVSNSNQLTQNEIMPPMDMASTGVNSVASSTMFLPTTTTDTITNIPTTTTTTTTIMSTTSMNQMKM